MAIFGLIIFFGIIYFIYWSSKSKPKTEEELEEIIYNENSFGNRRGESYKEYKTRISKDKIVKELQLERSLILDKKFYGYDDILLELDDFYSIIENKHICDANSLKSYKAYLSEINEYVAKLDKQGYIETEITTESYLQRYLLPNDSSKIGFKIYTILGTIHHPSSYKTLFLSFYNYIDGDNDYSKSNYLFTSPDYPKSKNEKGLGLKKGCGTILNLLRMSFAKKSYNFASWKHYIKMTKYLYR